MMSILSENFGNNEALRIAKRTKRIDDLVKNILDADRCIVSNHDCCAVTSVCVTFNYKFKSKVAEGVVASFTTYMYMWIHPQDREQGSEAYIRSTLNRLIGQVYRVRGSDFIIQGSVIPQPKFTAQYDNYHTFLYKSNTSNHNT